MFLYKKQEEFNCFTGIFEFCLVTLTHSYEYDMFYKKERDGLGDEYIDIG